ncbi:class I SAM-dependent methyltransferase [Rudaeicoccus suwonensis]|uniref:Putative methyltransferase n=1 Tax=Rudaeicoccus suwonensis TaxID=657409 RepID=A0A561E9S5_9MICO|nr:class I SAM-dependent methyltransferase [Rudaeicoccus suwonensis]TWE12365.1 putative methyltransferase [Rudaeicoccus suwonensis]
MSEDPENLAWAEFSDVLRLSGLEEDGEPHQIPWDAARFNTDHPLVDIGCGSGLSTVGLAQQFPDAEILAVEPDDRMRSLLMLRVAERAELRDRITVLPESILDAWLPTQCGGALLLNVIYFLGGRARDEFWARMAQVMVPGAPILMSRSYGGVPDKPVELSMIRSARMGRHEYQRWFQSEPVRDGRVEITNIYRVLRDGEQVREIVTRVAPLGLDEDLVLGEVPIGTFGIEEIDERYFAIRRQPDIVR